MLDFIVWTAIIGTGLCALVFLILAALIVASVIDMWRKRRSLHHAYPAPDRQAERVYGQQYFERAVKKD